MSNVWMKIKWVGCALVAAIMAVAAFLYGRRTPRVERAQASSKKARVRVLETALEAAKRDVEAAAASAEAASHIAKADKIETKLRLVRSQREEAARAVPDSDDDLAVHDNRRRASRRANGAA
ncbi:MAG: hypothetical protein HY791_02835 [Deltaproteobacteria bacterium]|nr:hypothetical protein [Deltaproteobacteria bacterium]